MGHGTITKPGARAGRASRLKRGATAERETRPIDSAIAELAGRQHGVVSCGQLLDLGLTSDARKGRLRTGRLHPIHRGVYAVGHRAITTRGKWMAAVLRGGPGAVLSHRPAGALHGLRGWSGRGAITIRSWRPSSNAVDIHTSRLAGDEVATIEGIPVTSVPRTILDLAVDLGQVGAEQAIAEAETRGLSDPNSLADLMDRYPGRRGNGIVREILAERSASLGLADGELEEWFQQFLIKHGIERPELNQPIELGPRTVRADCLWRAQKLIVELDGMRWHGSPGRASRDRARDRRLMLLGYRVIRVTWAHLREEPERLASDLRALLS